MDNNLDFYKIIGMNIERIRKQKGLSAEELGNRVGLTKKTIRRYETGDIRILNNRVLDIANALDNNPEELYKGTDVSKEPSANDLTRKDERDIQKKLQEMIDGLNSKDSYAAFDGQTLNEMDEEDRELLIASLENSLRLAKRLAKQKFTPKKYKK